MNFELSTRCKLAPAGEPISGYHDHEIGHTFDRTPHFNAWSESTGTSFKNRKYTLNYETDIVGIIGYNLMYIINILSFIKA